MKFAFSVRDNNLRPSTRSRLAAGPSNPSDYPCLLTPTVLLSGSWKDSAHSPRWCMRESTSRLYGLRTWRRRTVVIWKLGSGGGLVFLCWLLVWISRRGACISMIVSFMAHGMVRSYEKKEGTAVSVGKVHTNAWCICLPGPGTESQYTLGILTQSSNKSGRSP